MNSAPATHSQHPEREKIPTALLRGMLILVLCSLAIAAYARLTDRPLEATPPVDAPILAERDIVLSGEMNGSAMALQPDGQLIAALGPQEGGFIAGVERVVAYERQKRGAPRHAPVRLVKYVDGRLALIDETTGWRAELIGFGADNYAAFERLLAAPTR